jgi:fatty-acyl-CoA synthase
VSQERGPSDRAGRRQAMEAWVRALENTKDLGSRPDLTLCGMLDQLAATHGQRIALTDDQVTFTYQDLADRANRHARWAIRQGLRSGDVVGLLMANQPDYAAIWLGLTLAGCTVALLNTNLAGPAIIHGLSTAGSTALIVGTTLIPALESVTDQLPGNLRIWCHGADRVGEWRALEPEVAAMDPAPLSETECRRPMARDRALLIYTSGTTGMPKAANVTHARVIEWSLWFAGMMDSGPEDRLYDCLPMYHSVGGVVALGAMLVNGGSVLVRPRFSATRFWDDIVDGGCTIFQYIGEICRYLAVTPPHPKERAHRLRLACGNGLQGDVWEDIQARFAIPRILEFYAATEGSVSLYNCEGRPGAIGRVPPFLAHRFPTAIVRSDPETGEPLRDGDGLCIVCGPDETGEALGQVVEQAGAAARRFDGYTDAGASAAKLLRDVIHKGDVWFRTGDLMRKDAAGYYYFVDRMGDTFRWKGENVSTTEVAAVLRACPGVIEAVVYGVKVPGQEGRAGMAAITSGPDFDLETLRDHLAAALPDYAQPLFVRSRASLDVTGTFKLVKGKLAEESYDGTDDPVWFNDRQAGRFLSCDANVIRSIANGTRRV